MMHVRVNGGDHALVALEMYRFGRYAQGPLGACPLTAYAVMCNETTGEYHGVVLGNSACREILDCLGRSEGPLPTDVAIDPGTAVDVPRGTMTAAVRDCVRLIKRSELKGWFLLDIGLYGSTLLDPDVPRVFAWEDPPEGGDVGRTASDSPYGDSDQDFAERVRRGEW